MTDITTLKSLLFKLLIQLDILTFKFHLLETDSEIVTIKNKIEEILNVLE